MERSLLLVEVGPEDFKDEMLQKVLDRDGLDVTVLLNEPRADGFQYNWQNRFIDPETRLIRANFRDAEAIIRALEDHIAKLGKRFDGAATYMEEAVETTCLIQDHFTLPPITTGDPEALRDKYKMRQAFQKASLDQPTCYLCDTLEEVQARVKELCAYGSCIIKPHKLFFGLGIHRIDSVHDDVKSAFDDAMQIDFAQDPLKDIFDIPSHVIVEEYIPSREELSIEGVVHNGTPTIITPTAKFLTPEPKFDEIGHTTPRPPNHVKGHDQAMMVRVEQLVVAGCRALGLENCCFHAEVRIRPDGTPILGEIGARLAGDSIPILLDKSTGINLMRSMVKLAVGENPGVSHASQLDHSYASIVHLHEDALQRVQDGLQRLSERPSFERIVTYPHEVEGGGHIELLHESASEIAADRAWIGQEFAVHI